MCKILSPKVGSCKFFDKFQAWGARPSQHTVWASFSVLKSIRIKLGTGSPLIWAISKRSSIGLTRFEKKPQNYPKIAQCSTQSTFFHNPAISFNSYTLKKIKMCRSRKLEKEAIVTEVTLGRPIMNNLFQSSSRLPSYSL